MNMDVTVRDEIRKGSIEARTLVCGDCGHSYAVTSYARSGLCPKCGNIEMLAENVEPLRDSLSWRSDLGTGVIGRQNERQPFALRSDGKKVEAILAAHQQEWQLWARLVNNFSDPSFQSAYLTHTILKGSFEKAIERYRSHRSACVLLAETASEAELADLMLERIQALLAIRWQQTESRSHWLQSWYFLIPWESRTVQMALFLFGGWVMWAIFSFLNQF